MYFTCTGEQLFTEDSILTEQIDFIAKLSSYSESPHYKEMVDFISRLVTTDLELRMTSA